MGFATVAGGSRATAPSTGILASDIAVGSMVKLMESGSAVEYRVVHQGLPSSLYDASCNGCWLLRKDIHSQRQFHYDNIYENSFINTFLNGDFLNSLGDIEKSTIKQVKIPYRYNGGNSGTDKSGANGLSCKAFALSMRELRWSNMEDIPNDGAPLDYFDDFTAAKCIAYLNGIATSYWTRSPKTSSTSAVWRISEGGQPYATVSDNLYGVIPALILPSNALFDTDTMILKGVA